MSEKSKPTQPRRLADVTQWDIETDVAVVGFGGAGACAAIEAVDAGADVCVFELASAGGGSTALSSAEIYLGGNGGTRVQQACGYNDSTENMINYLKACFGSQADEEKIRIYCEGAVAHFNWLVDLGVPFKDSELKERAIMALTDDCLLFTGNEKVWPFTEVAQPVPRGHNLKIEGDNGGPLLTGILAEVAKQRGARIHYESRALTLIVDDQGAVHGLVVRIDQREHTVRARKGVVLCAGGFAMNQEMVKKFAPLFAELSPIGNPGDDGAGILMGMGVGASVINMQECFTTVPFYPPSSLTYGIVINDKGQRFINEDSYHGRVGYNALLQQSTSSRRIYLVADVEAYGDYEKMSYLGAQVVGTGDTVQELEQELELPEGSLQHTVELYNRNASNATDPLFHKSEAWLRPLKPPFVALDITLGRGAFYPFFTLGGLETQPTGEVLRVDGSPIPGLYAAGRTTAGIPRNAAGYASGMSVGDVTFFGRQAGKTVATRAG